VRFRALWGVINAVILVVVSRGAFSYFDGGYSVEVDEVSVATYVVDGDNFDVETDEEKSRRAALVDDRLSVVQYPVAMRATLT
jgi:hypothetical protein